MRARGHISEEGGHEAHLEALAYMSDSFFIGTVARVHKLTRFQRPKSQTNINMDESKTEEKTRAEYNAKPNINMMVSLDHSIYFHNPKGFRADEWMLTEMHTPWAGDGRGLVFQHIFARDGKLVATCVQEVLIDCTMQLSSFY
jgi:acyl-CoA thioesterase 8